MSNNANVKDYGCQFLGGRFAATNLFTLVRRYLVFALLVLLQFGALKVVTAQQLGTSFDHLSTGFSLSGSHQSLRCETCHINGIFKGTPKDCATCHAQGNPFGASTKSTKHIPTSAACDTCHAVGLASFSGIVFSHVTVQDAASCQNCHDGVHATGKSANHLRTNEPCSACHSTSTFDQSRIPANHIPTSAQSTCKSCHINADLRVMPSIAAIHANAPSTTANCAQCHSSANAAAMALPGMIPPIVSPPPNHIGMGSLGCENCHVGPNSSLQLPVQNGAKFNNSAFNHLGITSGCSSCHGPNVNSSSFFGITSIVVMPASGGAGPSSHLPTSTQCENCHLASTPSGLISSRATKTNGPGTGFMLPAPTAAMIHAGATGGCSSCHETNAVWLGVNQYPMNGFLGFQTRPQAAAGPFNVADPVHPMSGECSQCHIGYSFDNKNLLKPANHIPTSASSTCVSCHTSPDFSVMPSLTAIHANAPSTSSNCAQCHSAENAAAYAMPTMSPPIVGPPGNHLPTGAVPCESCHVGAGSSVQLPVQNGARFSNSAFSHSGISSGCANCHGPSVTGSSFYGISSIVVMPSSNGPGPNSHLPSSAGCETCHMANTPAGQISRSATKTTAPGTGFMLPAPTAAMIHAGATGGCSSCHETNSIWLGMSQYPMNGLLGFQTRPQAIAGQWNAGDPAHPTSGECSQCHAGFSFDTNSLAKPSNHIPTAASAACTACHVTGDFSVMPSIAVIHANAPSTSANCAQCHSAANAATYAMNTMIPALVGPPGNHIGMGSLGCENCHVDASGNSSLTLPVQNGAKFSNSAFSHTGITSGCSTCHSGSVAYFGVTPKSMTGLSPQHVPTAAACENCHVNSVPSTLIPLAGASGSMTTFANAQFSHGGISSGCSTCHGANVSGSSFYGITSIVVLPPSGSPGATSHIPASNNASCESCHLGSKPNALVPANATRTVPGSLFQSPAPTGSMIHSGVSSGCSSCHETGSSWLGVNLYPGSPSVLTPGASYTGFQARPNAAGGTYSITDAAHPIAGDCSNCHASTTTFTTASKPANHIPTSASATCTSCHAGTDFSVVPPLSLIHANAPSTSTNCAQCHGAAAASFAIPAIGFSIVGAPGNHIPMGSLDCVSCHVGSNSSIGSTPVADGAKFSGSLFSHSGISSGCDTCHGANVSSATFYGVTPMRMAGLSPAHVPTTAACETCHVNSVPVGLVPSTGMRTFSGAQFSHAGITSGCEACHGPGLANSFYGITSIVMPPTSPVGPSSHLPTSVACQNCHLGSLPSGLVPAVTTKTAGVNSGFQTPAPTASMIHAGVTGSCNSCHETGSVWMSMGQYPITTAAPFKGFQTRPQVSAGTFNVADGAHPTTGDCSDCHGGFSDFTAPSKPSNHIPTSASASCAACHTSSSYATMPTITAIHANAPSSTSNCAQCHGAAASTYAIPSANFSIKTTASNHIPMGALGCENCHVGSNSSLNLPVTDGATFANSAFSHSGITSGCKGCHGINVTVGTFDGVTPKSSGSLVPAHVPVSNSIPCETCHVNSIPSTLIPLSGATGSMTTFAGAQFSHSGITSGCDACHGPNITNSTFYGITKIIVMPPSAASGASSHLPTSTACESCHLGSTPANLVPGVATRNTPGSGFLSPAPTAATIHAGASGGCASCHDTNKVWMSVGQYPITTSAPFKGFQTRPQVAAGTFNVADGAHPATGECSNCHASLSDFTISATPANHIPFNPSAACAACHTSTDFSVMPTIAVIHANAPSSTTNCAQCHSTTNAANYAMPSMSPAIVTPPGTHISMGPLGCENCHVGSNSSLTLPVQNGAKFNNSAYSHIGVTTGCATCHGSNVVNGTFYGVTPKTISSLAPAHVPISNSMSCETCHVNSIPSNLVPFSGATGGQTTFANAQFSHSGITSGCDACHGPNITNSTFYGITKIIVMPPSAAPGASSHLPTSTTCESCHLGSTPASLVPGVSTRSTPGSGFLTPTPTASMIHAGVTGGCASCHDTNKVWMSMGQYPITTTAPFKGFQTRPQASAGTFYVADGAHPATGECSNCHASMNDFTVSVTPANHIPFNPASACTTCHTNPDFSVMPTIAAIHANAPSTTANCAQCHSTSNAPNFAMPTMSPAIVTPPGTHVPMGSLGCESCHVGSNSSLTLPVQNGAKFNNSAFSHTGFTSGCTTCHGSSVTVGTFFGVTPKTMTGLGPAPHIPTPASGACETCHINVPSGLVALTGGTGGNTFAGGKFSHTGITSGCDTCHGANISGSSFYGITSIVVLPPTTPTGSTAHIPSLNNAKCESCHMMSTPAGLVAANATQSVPNTAFKSPVPTGAMIHANTSAGCSSCHESGMSWIGVGLYTRSPTSYVAGATYVGFQTRPIAAGTGYSVADAAHPTTGDCSQCHGSTTNFTVAAKPSNHIPTATSASCTACHTNISSTDANFSVMPSLTNIHANAPTPSSNCAQCHSVANAANYAIPAAGFTIKAPDVKHVPFGSTPCETCHVGPGSSLQLPVVNGALFSGSLYSHLGVTTGCETCHGSSITTSSFTGISKIVVMPSSSGPGASKHIPSSTVCENCHLGSTPSGLVSVTGSATLPGSGFKLPAPTGAMIHAGVTTGCNSCHEQNYTWMSISQYPISPTVVTSGASYKGFQTRPYGSATTYSVLDAGHPATGDCSQCHNSTTVFTAEGKPAGHMPTSVAACGTCHIAQPDYSYAAGKLASNDILHTGISSGCANCHTAGPGAGPFAGCATQAACSSPPPVNYQPMVMPVASGSQLAHVPSGSTPCESCHSKTNFTSFSGMNMKSGTSGTTSHTAVASLTCMGCHEFGSAWYGVTGLLTRVPSKHTTTSRKPPNDCKNCHDYNGGFRAQIKPIMREAAVNPDLGRMMPNLQVNRPTRGSLGNNYDHLGVEPGKCKTCHDGQRATGLPARHLMVNLSCDTCHRTTSWLPAQFSHNGVSPNTCMACHNGISASARPSGHFMSARSCDSCHKTNTWLPVTYSHMSPLYQPLPDKLTCVSCHVTNSEIIPRQMRALDRPKPIPVGH